MTRPRRDTTSGRVYLDLRARARAEGRPTDELLVLYVLERFLYRLSVSPHRERLILKGGMLLAALDQRRPTRDVDLLATAVANDIDNIAAVVREIAMIDVDDGVVFDTDRTTTQQIREHDLYAGARVVVPATVDRRSNRCESTSTWTPGHPGPQRARRRRAGSATVIVLHCIAPSCRGVGNGAFYYESAARRGST